MARWYKEVVEAPKNSYIKVVAGTDSVPDIENVHLTNDITAPKVRLANIDDTHPLKGSLICSELNKKFSERRKLKNHDILSVNEYLNVNSNKNLIYRQKDSVIKYTKEYLKLLTKKYLEEPDFFDRARLSHKSKSN